VMMLLGIVGVSPIGFVAAIGAAILVLVLSILLAVRARSAPMSSETANHTGVSG